MAVVTNGEAAKKNALFTKTLPEPETAHEKPLGPRVESLTDISKKRRLRYCTSKSDGDPLAYENFLLECAGLS